MKKLFRILIFTMLLGAVLVSTAFAADNGTAATMRMSFTEGDVSVTDKSGEGVDINKDMRLFDGYTVETGEKSFAWFLLDDSKACSLDEDSSVRLEKSGKSLKLTVVSGTLFFNVSEKLSDDEKLEIATATMLTGIRGTSGMVHVVDDKLTVFALFDGAAEVSAVNEDGTKRGEAVLLTAGQCIEASFIDLEKARENGYTGDSRLHLPGEPDISSLSRFVISEIINSADLKDRIDPELYAKTEKAYNESFLLSDYENSRLHLHEYPDTQERTYKWTPDYKFCTGYVRCSVCGQLLTETVPADYSLLTYPDCYNYGFGCLTADFTHIAFSDQSAADYPGALGHAWGAPVFVWGPNNTTCTVTVTCARDPSHTDTAAATVTTVTTPPDCTNPGTISYIATANVAGMTVSETRTVQTSAALGHVWSAPSFTWDANCSSATAHTVCINGCSPAQTLDIPCIVYPSPNVPTQLPTCSSVGYEYFMAEVNIPSGAAGTATKFFDQNSNTIPATGKHIYAAPVFSTYSSGGVYYIDGSIKCSTCGNVIIQEVAVATYNKGIYTATFADPAFGGTVSIAG